MKRRKNKKAVELNITTIIVVILAVLALVIIALSFTGGMSQMWEWISSIWGGQAGIQEAQAVATCNLYLKIPGDRYSFCCIEQEIRGRGKITCPTLAQARGWEGFDDGAMTFCDDYSCP
jgi:hypothetical protein